MSDYQNGLADAAKQQKASSLLGQAGLSGAFQGIQKVVTVGDLRRFLEGYADHIELAVAGPPSLEIEYEATTGRLLLKAGPTRQKFLIPGRGF